MIWNKQKALILNLLAYDTSPSILHLPTLPFVFCLYSKAAGHKRKKIPPPFPQQSGRAEEVGAESPVAGWPDQKMQCEAPWAPVYLEGRDYNPGWLSLFAIENGL